MNFSESGGNERWLEPGAGAGTEGGARAGAGGTGGTDTTRQVGYYMLYYWTGEILYTGTLPLDRWDFLYSTTRQVREILLY